MLVLARKKHQKIHIGADIEVTIIRIDGDRVHLGITAPAAAVILRSELLTRSRDGTPAVSDLPQQ